MRNILRLSCFILLLMVTTAASAWKFKVESPVEGEVTSIPSIKLRIPGGGYLYEYFAVECEITSSNGTSTEVALANQNPDYVETNYLFNEITAPGTYTLKINENAFHLNDNWKEGEGCEPMEFSWTIKGESQGGGDDSGDSGDGGDGDDSGQGGDQGGQGSGTSNNGQEMGRAIPLTIDDEVKFTPTNNVCWFVFNAEKACTLQYTINTAKEMSAKHTLDGVNYTNIPGNEFNVTRGLNYLLIEFYNSIPGSISINEKNSEPEPEVVKGQNIENAIELTIDGESKSFKPVTIGTDHYIYFKFTPSESCTVQYSITGASVNKVSFSYDGNEFTEIINNEFEVQSQQLTYILVECYSSQPGYISLTKKEETPIDPASQIINACTPHYDIENDKLYLVWPEDMDITFDEFFTSAYCEGYTGFITPILGKNPSNNAKNNCISINFSNGLSEGKYGIIIRSVTFNGTQQAELTIPFEVKVFLINEAEGDADVNNKLAAAIEEGETVNFKSDRKLSKDNWNTLCLPFDVDASDFAKVLEVSSIENNKVVFRSIESTATLEAGKPYLVKAKQANDGKSLAYSNVTIRVDEPEEVSFGNNECSVCGTFNAMTLNGQYFISKNKFYYANTDVTMKGFRFYITLPSNAQVRSFSIDDNIIETAIEEMEATGANSASVTFDLSGKRVAVKKGIVIENGKKVMY